MITLACVIGISAAAQTNSMVSAAAVELEKTDSTAAIKIGSSESTAAAGTTVATTSAAGITASASSGVADDTTFKAFVYGLADSASLAIRSGADEGATVIAQLPTDSSGFVAFRETQGNPRSRAKSDGSRARRIRAGDVEGWVDDRFIRPLPRISPPEISGESDPALLAAGMQAIQGLQDLKLLAELMGSGESLDVYAALACKPNVLQSWELTVEGLQASFEVNTCYGNDEKKSLKTHTWAEYLSAAHGFYALTSTERIVLNERYGIGFDTGTSYLVEQRYPVATHKIISYLYLGSKGHESPDWDEVGFVFRIAGNRLELVAFYHDFFFNV